MGVHRIKGTTHIDIVFNTQRGGLCEPVVTVLPQGWQVNATTTVVQHLKHKCDVQYGYWDIPAHNYALKQPTMHSLGHALHARGVSTSNR
jgi:hypothetical protein